MEVNKGSKACLKVQTFVLLMLMLFCFFVNVKVQRHVHGGQQRYIIVEAH